LEPLAEQGELPLAADERRPMAREVEAGTRQRPDPPPDPDRLVRACPRDRRRLPILDRVARPPEGRTVDENHVHGGGMPKAGGRLGDLAEGDALPPLPESGSPD